jgi:hypothetical protein
MHLAALVVGTIVVVAIGTFLIRHIGWPRDLAGLVKWGLVLLATAVVFVGLPQLLADFPRRELPLVDAGAVAFALAFIALSAIGYFGWANEAGKREKRELYEERARALPRRRLPPIAPQMNEPPVENGFLPLGGNPPPPPEE